MRIRVSVFFDGTGNNRYNTMYRREHGGAVIGDADHSGSYVNELSNVARLANTIETPSEGEDQHIAVYVEGIGTSRGEADDELGMAFGTEERGVEARAVGCFLHIKARIEALAAGRDRIDRLRVDCFGFSRGAAGARHLVYLMTRSESGLEARLRDDGYTVDLFEIPFVGLFDTVAHLGVEVADDTEELHLDALSDGRVRQVVQLAAGDEHRYNFPLTDVSSAGSRGRQTFLPGVHSDVGGGYNDITAGDMTESGLILFDIPGGADGGMEVAERCEAIRRELIDLGWYGEDEITASVHSVTGNRSGISHTYSFVPLAIMAAKAGEQGLRFNLDEYSYSGDAFLTAVHDEILDNEHDDRYWLTSSTERLRRLRRGYLHFSSHYAPLAHGLARPNEPQFHSREAGWEINQTNLMHGTRRRRIYRG